MRSCACPAERSRAAAGPVRCTARFSGLYRFTLTAVIFGSSFAGRAAFQDDLPPLPSLSESSLLSFQPDVQSQIRSALETARSRPQDAELVGRLGMIFHAYEKFEVAGVFYERAHGLDPSKFRWLYYLGLVKQKLGEDEKAVAFFRKAAQARPEFTPAQVRLGQALLSAGELQESRRAYDQILEQEPDLAVAYYELGEVLSASGETREALQNYRRASELAPDFGAAHYALALKYRDLGKISQAQEHLALYRAHRQNRPQLSDPLLDSVHALARGAIAHFDRGRLLEAEGKLEAAAAAYEQTLKLDAHFGQAHVNLISIYSLLSRFDEAEKHYRAGLAVNPNLAELHYNYGLLLVQRGQFAEAARAFQKALELNPYFADAHNNRGRMLEQEGQFKEAARHFQLAVQNDPGHRLARFNLGRMLIKGGRHKEAISQLLKTLTIRDEQTPTFLYVLADAYVRAGDLEKGLESLRRAIREARSFEQHELAARMEQDLREMEQKTQ